MTTLKLYAIGVYSPDPQAWSRWDEVTLVIAESEEQALEVAGAHPVDTVVEVPFDKPRLVVAVPSADERKDW